MKRLTRQSFTAKGCTEMSRSGYSDDCDGWALIRWRGAVTSAIRGERGQRTLRELLVALDAMPEKKLITDELEAGGEFCALGVLGAARGIEMKDVDTEDREAVASMFNIAPALAAEIMYANDEYGDDYEWHRVVICGPMRRWERHEQSVRILNPRAAEVRWARMRQWVAAKIKEAS